MGMQTKIYKAIVFFGIVLACNQSAFEVRAQNQRVRLKGISDLLTLTSCSDRGLKPPPEVYAIWKNAVNAREHHQWDVAISLFQTLIDKYQSVECGVSEDGPYSIGSIAYPSLSAVRCLQSRNGLEPLAVSAKDLLDKIIRIVTSAELRKSETELKKTISDLMACEMWRTQLPDGEPVLTRLDMASDVIVWVNARVDWKKVYLDKKEKPEYSDVIYWVSASSNPKGDAGRDLGFGFRETPHGWQWNHLMISFSSFESIGNGGEAPNAAPAPPPPPAPSPPKSVAPPPPKAPSP